MTKLDEKRLLARTGDPDSCVNAALEGLRSSIARWANEGTEFVTAVPGLSLFRSRAPTKPADCMYEPSICVVAQGAKQVTLGARTFVYEPHHYLLSSVHLPAFVQIIEASLDRPYLGLVLKLDLREISQLMLGSDLPSPHARNPDSGMALGEMTAVVLDAFHRLTELLADEQDIPILAPLIKREIYYRLLRGDQGERLRQIASAGSQSRQIARAIDWLRLNFAQPLSVDSLAARVRMSTSTFHHHFRAMTEITPLQFQKQLRLQEARRLMLVEHMDAAAAAFQVGYDSPSQFSREYSRLFGDSPLRDITKLRKNERLNEPFPQTAPR